VVRVFCGADTEQLRSVAAVLSDVRRAVDDVMAGLVRAAEQLVWSGSDGDAFRESLRGAGGAGAGRLVAVLGECAVLLRDQARAQDETSASLDGMGVGSSDSTGEVQVSGSAAGNGLPLQGGSVRLQGPGAVTVPDGELRVDAAEWSFGDVGQVDADNRAAIDAERMRLVSKVADGTSSASDRMRLALYERILADGSKTVLFFDPNGDGRMAVVEGNLATAANIAVTVPGISNNLDNFGNLVDEGERLFGASGPSNTAVITWLGYDAPVGIPGWNPLRIANEVFDADMAEVGAEQLRSFMYGLRATQPDAELTVIGHSYGSLVTGIAARSGFPVDNIVFIGSPGVGADSVADFNLPEGTNVYAASFDGWNTDAPAGRLEAAAWGAGSAIAEAVDFRDDIVTDTGEVFRRFGRVPTDPAFGATELDVGGRGPSVDDPFSHKYYDPGSRSLMVISSVVNGTAGRSGGW
jgi:pimeloyl-ACP methyl ester carboxylesterase